MSNITYLAGGTQLAGSGAAISLLGVQDVQLELARERRAQSNAEDKMREAIEVEQAQAFGMLAAEHFPSYCRECNTAMGYYHQSPWNKWYCDSCGHGYSAPVFTCAKTPLKCDNTYCRKCFLRRCKLVPPTNAQVPSPSLPPAKTRLPKVAKKKEKKVKVAATLGNVEGDEALFREAIEEAWVDSRKEVEHLLRMLRMKAPVRQVADDKKVVKEASVKVARQRIRASTKGWNVIKADEQSLNYDAIGSKEEMVAFAKKIERWYHEKPGDVVSELEDNLRFPPSMDTLSILSAVSNALLAKDDVVATYGGILSELLALRQYTQKPIDIDRDVMWDDVPTLEEAGSVKAEYESMYSDWYWEDGSKRNGSIFGPVCSALRDQGPSGTGAAWSEEIVRKWVKWICTVAAVCSDHGSAKHVFRGLGGGCLPAGVVEKHRALSAGSVIGWPALSSTSFDEKASLDYMHGTAANSINKPSPTSPGTIFFTIKDVHTGKVLSSLSQYPDEAELLFGPFNMFRVDSVEPDASNPFRNSRGEPMGLLISLTSLGPVDCSSFYYEVRKDAVRASRRLQSDTSLERLEVIRYLCNASGSSKNPEELLGSCTDTKSYLSILSKILADKDQAQETKVRGAQEGVLCAELMRGLAGCGRLEGEAHDLYGLGVLLRQKIEGLEGQLRDASCAIADYEAREEARCEGHEAAVDEAAESEIEESPPPAPASSADTLSTLVFEEPQYVRMAPFPYGLRAVDTPQLREVLFS
eukprot:TRINITY_DN391_c2_g1_i1.p1 TRINITY_DN391_c2_g1~~TRINITY_DN391_c2_g1_i1.p1  ORF type:complete len:752 (+),score=241.94 TRINITY_DN391_c2_g1_i1:292-2547(+)